MSLVTSALILQGRYNYLISHIVLNVLEISVLCSRFIFQHYNFTYLNSSFSRRKQWTTPPCFCLFPDVLMAHFLGWDFFPADSRGRESNVLVSAKNANIYSVLGINFTNIWVIKRWQLGGDGHAEIYACKEGGVQDSGAWRGQWYNAKDAKDGEPLIVVVMMRRMMIEVMIFGWCDGIGYTGHAHTRRIMN